MEIIMQTKSSADVIFEKRNRSSEIIIVLFEYCNFACEFCPQNHNSKIGLSYNEIVSKADTVIDYINNNKFATEFVVRIMGGELFNDEIVTDELLSAYSQLLHRIRTESDLNDRDLEFVYVTNFSMKECRDKVLEYIQKETDSQFVVSYDIKGRFNAKNLEIFKENIEIYADYIRNVNTVMTRQNIEEVLKGHEYFDYLYDRFDYSWDMYVKTTESMHEAPYESQVLEFYKLLVDKYPEVEYIRPFLKKPELGSFNHTICSRGNNLSIDEYGNRLDDGCAGTHYLKRQDIAVATRSNTDFIHSSVDDFLEKYNCFACPFFQRCPMACFSGIKSGNMIDDIDTCINKLTFEYVEEKWKS